MHSVCSRTKIWTILLLGAASGASVTPSAAAVDNCTTGSGEYAYCAVGSPGIEVVKADLVAGRGKYSRMFQTQFISDEPRRALAGA